MTTATATWRDSYYGRMTDRLGRDPVVTPGDHGRADVANGPMSKWLRFHQAADLVYVTDPEGVPRALTRHQVSVLEAVRVVADRGIRVTLRDIAGELHVAPSTVYRAVVKLTAMGFIAYQSNRGRYGGSMFVTRRPTDGLEWCRDAAKATVRKWWKASEDRIARLRANVAACLPGREKDLYPETDTRHWTGSNIREPWTEADVADIVNEW